MKKKISKVKKDKEKEKIPEPKQQEAKEEFDFGGLPKRELKKNLGCG